MPILGYVFTGFLDSGKTSFIKDTLADPEFKEKGEMTLILSMEDGEVELDEDFLNAHDAHLEHFTSSIEITNEKISELVKKYKPKHIFFEFNGMEATSELLTRELSEDVVIVEVLTTINAQTFDLYIKNMRSLVYEQLRYSDLVICNRISDNIKYSMLRGNIKAINQSAQIIYETIDGQITQSIPDSELPFDVNADIIEIKDDDYGLWYMDCMEHNEKYDGKRIIVRGKYLADIPKMKQTVAFGRQAMVCCENDTSMIGMALTNFKKEEAKIGEWLEVKAIVRFTDDGKDGKTIVLYPDLITRYSNPPKDEYVYFS